MTPYPLNGPDLARTVLWDRAIVDAQVCLDMARRADVASAGGLRPMSVQAVGISSDAPFPSHSDLFMTSRMLRDHAVVRFCSIFGRQKASDDGRIAGTSGKPELRTAFEDFAADGSFTAARIHAMINLLLGLRDQVIAHQDGGRFTATHTVEVSAVGQIAGTAVAPLDWRSMTPEDLQDFERLLVAAMRFSMHTKKLFAAISAT